MSPSMVNCQPGRTPLQLIHRVSGRAGDPEAIVAHAPPMALMIPAVVRKDRDRRDPGVGVDQGLGETAK